MCAERWWVTTNFFGEGGQKVIGPFGSSYLAMNVRALMEKTEGHYTYFVDQEKGGGEGR